MEEAVSAAAQADAGGKSDVDELFEEAGRFLVKNEKASTGSLQRNVRIGFNRAARIMDQLADAGVVSKENGTKPREVLMNEQQYEDFLKSRNS